MALSRPSQSPIIDVGGKCEPTCETSGIENGEHSRDIEDTEDDIEVMENKEPVTSPCNSTNSPNARSTEMINNSTAENNAISRDVHDSLIERTLECSASDASSLIMRGKFSIASILGMDNSEERVYSHADSSETTSSRKRSVQDGDQTSDSVIQQEDITTQILKARYVAEMLTSRDVSADHLHQRSSTVQMDVSVDKEQDNIHPSKNSFAHPNDLIALYNYCGDTAVHNSPIRQAETNIRLWQDLFLNRRSSVSNAGLNFPYSLQARNLYFQQRCRTPLQALYLQQQHHQRNFNHGKFPSSAALLHQLWSNETPSTNLPRTMQTPVSYNSTHLNSVRSLDQANRQVEQVGNGKESNHPKKG